MIPLPHQKLNWIFDAAIGNNLGLFYLINCKKKSCRSRTVFGVWQPKGESLLEIRKKNQKNEPGISCVITTVVEYSYEALLMHFTQHRCCGQSPLEAEPSSCGFGWEPVVKDCAQGDLPWAPGTTEMHFWVCFSKRWTVCTLAVLGWTERAARWSLTPLLVPVVHPHRDMWNQWFPFKIIRFFFGTGLCSLAGCSTGF